MKLAEYAESASRSQRLLAQTERDFRTATRGVDLAVSGQSVSPPRPAGQPHGLDKVVEVQWSGPLEEVVKRIANESGYQYVVTGRRPPLPIIVSLATTRASLYDALMDVGQQAGNAASVVVKTSTRTLEVRYPGGR